MNIARITTTYQLDEDRIRLAASDAQGGVCQLWLTRRLAERLVPGLLRLLDAATPSSAVPEDESVSPEAARLKPAAAQAYAQLQARLSRKSAQAVAVEPATPALLLTGARMQSTAAGRVMIIFDAVQGEPSTLVMTQAELRQWLEALRRAFDKGGWRADLWPAWLEPRRSEKK